MDAAKRVPNALNEERPPKKGALLHFPAFFASKTLHELVIAFPMRL